MLSEIDEVGVADQASRFLDTEATAYAMTRQFDLLGADTGCISTLYPTFAPAAAPVPTARRGCSPAARWA